MRIVFLFSAMVLWCVGAGVAPHPYAFVAAIVLVFIGADLLERSRAAGLLVSSIALCLSLAASDIVLRAVTASSMQIRAFDRLFEYHPDLRGRFRYHPDSRIDTESVGDLAAHGHPELGVRRRELFVTDSLGMRNEPGAESRPAEIILLGDSIAAGISTTQDETISVQLAASTRRSVYDLAVPGTPADELYMLETELPHLHPVPGGWLVWLLFGANDLVDSYDVLRYADDPEHTTAIDRLLLQLRTFQIRSPLTRIIGALTSPSEVIVARPPAVPGPLLFLKPYLETARRPESEFEGHPNMPLLVQSLERGTKLARSAGLHTAVFMVPSKEEIYDAEANRSESSPFAAAVQKHCVTLGLPCIDLKPAMLAASRQALAEGRLLYWPDDTHWNPEGQRVGAALIAKELERLERSATGVVPDTSKG